MERTEAAIREAVEQAERIAGTNVENAFVGFSAGGLVSTVASVEVGIGWRKIEKSDIDNLLVAGRDSINPVGSMILHVLPALYKPAGLQCVMKPLGLPSPHPPVSLHVIPAR